MQHGKSLQCLKESKWSPSQYSIPPSLLIFFRICPLNLILKKALNCTVSKTLKLKCTIKVLYCIRPSCKNLVYILSRQRYTILLWFMWMENFSNIWTEVKRLSINSLWWYKSNKKIQNCKFLLSQWDTFALAIRCLTISRVSSNLRQECLRENKPLWKTMSRICKFSKFYGTFIRYL